MIFPSVNSLLAELGHPGDGRQADTHVLERLIGRLETNDLLQVLSGRQGHRKTGVVGPASLELLQSIPTHSSFFQAVLDLLLVAKQSHLKIAEAGFNNRLAEGLH